MIKKTILRLSEIRFSLITSFIIAIKSMERLSSILLNRCQYQHQ